MYLDHKCLPRDLAEVLMAKQLPCGQHDASARSILPPKAAVQVQWLPCTTSPVSEGLRAFISKQSL